MPSPPIIVGLPVAATRDARVQSLPMPIPRTAAKATTNTSCMPLITRRHDLALLVTVADRLCPQMLTRPEQDWLGVEVPVIIAKRPICFMSQLDPDIRRVRQRGIGGNGHFGRIAVRVQAETSSRSTLRP